MKKLLCLALSMMMVLCMFAVPVSAAGTADKDLGEMVSHREYIDENGDQVVETLYVNMFDDRSAFAARQGGAGRFTEIKSYAGAGNELDVELELSATFEFDSTTNKVTVYDVEGTVLDQGPSVTITSERVNPTAGNSLTSTGSATASYTVGRKLWGGATKTTTMKLKVTSHGVSSVS